MKSTTQNLPSLWNLALTTMGRLPNQGPSGLGHFVRSLACLTHSSRFTLPGKNSIAMLTSSSILDVIFAICSNLKIPRAFNFSSMNGPIPSIPEGYLCPMPMLHR